MTITPMTFTPDDNAPPDANRTPDGNHIPDGNHTRWQSSGNPVVIR